MPIFLDANDPKHVASASKIEIDTGNPGQKAVIFSGIAIPSWNLNDDNHIHSDVVTINLRYTVLAVEQFTVCLGLASIYNDDSAFLFADDTYSLSVDYNSQELLLQVNVALMGDPASLNRFGYQVVTVLTTQSTGISGTIRFGRDVFDASGLDSTQVEQLFLVAADLMTYVNTGGLGSNQYTPLAYGTITGMNQSGNDFDVTYSIPGAPYNQQLYVVIQNGPSFTPGETTAIAQTAGPSPVVLTVGSPSVSGVDFRVVANINK